MDLLARRMMMQPRGGGGHNLPPEYQEVEYLGKIGIEICCPVVAINEVGIIKGKIMGAVGDVYGRFQQWHNSFFLGINNITYIDNWNPASLADVWPTDAPFEIEINVLDISNFFCKINGEVVSTYSFSRRIGTNYNIGPFGGSDHGYGRGGYYYWMETYNLEGVLSHKLVPCYRKADNYPCFYDLVTNQEAQWNGSLSSVKIGPDVN